MYRSLVRLGIVSVAVVMAFSLVPASAASFPDSIPLPTGFQPEGIAIGNGTTFYVGSIPTGQIFRGDLSTGEGEVFIEPEDRQAIGLDVDHRGRLFVAGGPTGQAYVYDAETGAEIASYQLTEDSAFINDVVVTRDAAWFTDSFNAFLYRIPIRSGGALGDQDDVEALEVGGDFELQDGFNLNGIDATRDGRTLVVVQSNTGTLFAVDPSSGVADAIDLGGDSVPFGDGIVLDRKRLYVVQNQLDQVARIRLAPDLGSGSIVEILTDPDFDVPTTADLFGRWLYVVNARFGVEEPETATYSVEQVATR